jgi:hypothetical protein
MPLFAFATFGFLGVFSTWRNTMAHHIAQRTYTWAAWNYKLSQLLTIEFLKEIDPCFGYEPTMCDFGGNAIHLCFCSIKAYQSHHTKSNNFLNYRTNLWGFKNSWCIKASTIMSIINCLHINPNKKLFDHQNWTWLNEFIFSPNCITPY